MDERRRDPRTSKPYSLGNLLRLRAAAEGWSAAVVGTPEGFLMGSSREPGDRQAARIAAHASQELFGKGQAWFRVIAPSRPEAQLLGTRFEAGGRSVFAAVLLETAGRSLDLDALTACVRRILCEPAEEARGSARALEAAA